MAMHSPRRYLMTIRAKVALGVTALSMLVLGIFTVWQLHSMRIDFGRVLAAQQDAIVEHVADDLDAQLREHLEIIRRSAESLPRDALDSPARLRAFFSSDATLLALFDDILMMDLAGQVVADVPELPGRTAVNAADREFFQRLIRTGEAVISEPLLSKHRQEPIVNVAAPVRDAGGRIVAVLTGVLRLGKDNVLGSLANAKVGRSGYFSLITRGPEPMYVIHPERERILQPRARRGTTGGITAALSGNRGGTVEDINSQGIRALFSYRPLRTTDWLLVAVLPSDEAFAPIVAAQRDLAGAAVVMAILIGALAWLLTDRLLAPLTRLRDHVESMRDAGVASPAPVERPDEIGDLARTFNRFCEERSRSTERLERQTAELRLASKVFETTADAVIVSDASDRVIMVNPAFARLTGFQPGELVGRILAETPFRPIDPAQSAERMAIQRRQGYVTAEVLRYRKDGSELPLWVTASNVTDEHGEVTHFVRVFTDISHLKQSQRALEKLANLDPLTGLLNRRVFDERLAAAIARASHTNAGLALMFVDLDSFKAVNDALGHECGDEMLRAFAARLNACVRGSEVLARFGGDEFAIILDEGSGADEARQVASRVLAMCEQPLVVAGNTLHLSASIGIAAYPADGTEVGSLLRSADAAMYLAKRSGGNRVAGLRKAPSQLS